ncbi:PHB depolymerase family esterase [Roseomonas sp. BN140053]|uniref:extracellular catalytic domain type 1 short-chain-length polyhydroxyalkanoate depolymerase n=1 Tax=Roseomonas sp. BN140053 TaxID=3391898 RepID=UPI0039EA433E
MFGQNGSRPSLDELVRHGARWARRHGTAAAATAAAQPDRLSDVSGFGSDPGNLRMRVYLPADLPAGAPLVVALHGCTQTAAGYDAGCGWSALAERHGFALLLPEQRRENNPKTCFNWFEPGDAARGAGEALSIRQMIGHLLDTHKLDPRRVFISGLSAGGAMTAVMLATYPELFAGGAIIAGLPFGAATSVPQAFEAMFQGRTQPARSWGDLVRGASPHRGPWPAVSVWHGDADATVKPVNAEESLKQWRDVLGLPEQPDASEQVGSHLRRVWRGRDGRAVLESHAIAGMGHGVPVYPGEGPGRGGAAGPFILDVGVSSTHMIAESWGLLRDGEAAAPHPAAARPAPGRSSAGGPRVIEVGPDGEVRVDPPRPAQAEAPHRPAAGAGTGAGTDRRAPGPLDPGAVIRKALQAAGLLRP